MEKKAYRNDIRNLNVDRVIHWILLSQLLSLLPLFKLVPYWIVLVCIVVGGWRMAVNHYQLLLPNRLITFLIGVLAAFLIFRTYGTLISREAGVSLIVLMFSLKLLEMRQFRDAILILFLSYFLLIVNFLYYEHIVMVIYLFATVFVITLSLIVLNSINDSVSYKKLVSMTVTLFTMAVPVCMMMFVFFPRLSHPLWQMPGSSTGTTGFSETMSPGTISELFQSEDIAFRVKFRQGQPKVESTQMYWRGVVLSEYDGLTWTKSATRAIGSPDIREKSQPIEYTVVLEPHNKKWLFGLDIPEIYQGSMIIHDDLTLESERNVRSVQSYSLTSYLDYRFGLELNPVEKEQYTQLPSGFNPKTVDWAKERRSKASSDETFVQGLLTYINKNAFFYTGTPPVYLENMVDDFWFNGKRGYCEHYSNAFVYILRAAGIPARILTGYSGGEYNPYGDYLIVRSKDAHAWAEVWLEDEGWVRVDPTAAIHPSRVEPILAERMEKRSALDRLVVNNDLDSYIADISSMQAFKLTIDAINHAWNEWFLGFDKDKQLEFFDLFGLDISTPNELLKWFVMVVVVGMSIFGFVILRKRKTGDTVTVAMAGLSKRLHKKGIHWPAGEAPLSFFERLKEQFPDKQAQLNELQSAYSTIRYQAPTRAKQALKEKKDVAQKIRHFASQI